MSTKTLQGSNDDVLVTVNVNFPNGIVFRYFSSLMFDTAIYCRSTIDLLHLFGCSLNPADREGRTPLIVCTLYNNVDAVRLLLSLGADTTKTTNDGHTALHLAFREEVKELLLEHEQTTVNMI